jgi:hypothetical protein
MEVINELGGGRESDQRDLEVMTTALADPTVWILRELLHACWGELARRGSRDTVHRGRSAMLAERLQLRTYKAGNRAFLFASRWRCGPTE